jgi:hypothetical protein
LTEIKCRLTPTQSIEHLLACLLKGRQSRAKPSSTAKSKAKQSTKHKANQTKQGKAVAVSQRDCNGVEL